MKPKHGDLVVWWVPQMPMKSFKVPVATLAEAKLILDTLANYDLFQFENNVKPDYANAGGLNVFDAHDTLDSPDGSWLAWRDEDGEEVDTHELDDLRKNPPRWEMEEVYAGK